MNELNAQIARIQLSIQAAVANFSNIVPSQDEPAALANAALLLSNAADALDALSNLDNEM